MAHSLEQRIGRARQNECRFPFNLLPRDLVAAIERIVYVSVESTRIIEGLPREVTDGSG